MWPTAIFIATAVLFIATALKALHNLRWTKRLPYRQDLGQDERPQPAPELRCSVVVAARDEAARIEGTLQRLLAQRGVQIECIVVDDRSIDGTSQILQTLAKADSRVRVKRVEVLPPGWLGKCHACHVGAAEATGDWILFTDADCWLTPDLIARAVRVAEQERADHITLSPGTVLNNLPARSWHLLFLTSFLNWFYGVNRDRPRAYLGFGAFNLVKAAAYRECGGYEKLRLTVLDDVRFGLLLRRAGKRTRAFLGQHDVECHWGSSVRSMAKIMEKNYFAALDYRLGFVLALSAVMLVIPGVLVAGFASATPAGLLAGLSPLFMILPGAILAKRLGWSRTCAVGMPFMFPVLFCAILNSTWVTLRQGGVRWRDTFYPLKELRAGTVRHF